MKCARCSRPSGPNEIWCPKCGQKLRFTDEEKNALRVDNAEMFQPDNPERIRKFSSYPTLIHNLTWLLEEYTTKHCGIRVECESRGFVGACLSCLCEKMLLPDILRQIQAENSMVKVHNGYVFHWHAKPTPED